MERNNTDTLTHPLPDAETAAHAIADPTLDPLQLLMKEASRYPLLRPDEEIELAKRIERGDLSAKERMTNSNLRLVMSIARRYQGQGLSMGDLVQEGMLGLIRAVEKFDWRKGFRFSTYATLWIRQSIQRGLENSSRTIRLPVHIAQRSRKIARVEREMAVKLGREPTDEEVALEAELDLEEVIEIRKADRPPASLDQTVGEEGDTPLGALLPAQQVDPAEEVAEDLQAKTVEAAIAELPEDERDVITLRFGAGNHEPHSQTQASRKLGISGQKVRKLEEQALRRLERKPELVALRSAA